MAFLRYIALFALVAFYMSSSHAQERRVSPCYEKAPEGNYVNKTCGGFANAKCPEECTCTYDNTGSSLGYCAPK